MSLDLVNDLPLSSFILYSTPTQRVYMPPHGRPLQSRHRTYAQILAGNDRSQDQWSHDWEYGQDYGVDRLEHLDDMDDTNAWPPIGTALGGVGEEDEGELRDEIPGNGAGEGTGWDARSAAYV